MRDLLKPFDTWPPSELGGGADAWASGAPQIAPLPIDPWVASSLLQKAIRRGDADMAERAAITLYRRRGRGVWRRLLLIAFEDIGIASIGALRQTAKAANDPGWRLAFGEEAQGIRRFARALAGIVKDRSADYLICAARHHPEFAPARARIGSMSIAQRLEGVANASLALPERALAAWHVSGIEWGRERVVGKGDLEQLMILFLHLGAPSELVDATRIAAHRVREPIVLMIPLLWLAAPPSDPDIVEEAIPPFPTIGGVPSYAFDKHTAVGKLAIQRLAREPGVVREALAALAPPERRDAVAAMAAFYADGAPVARRRRWVGSDALERLGIEADIVEAGASLDAVAPLLRAFRDALDRLNALRAELVGRSARAER